MPRWLENSYCKLSSSFLFRPLILPQWKGVRSDSASLGLLLALIIDEELAIR